MNAVGLRIIGLEGAARGLVVETQFNPKEVSIDKSVPCQLTTPRGRRGLRFTAAEPRTMSFG
jgi:hypothetical protein